MNVGASDILTVCLLAFQVYKKCKESSEQFRRIDTELGNLRNTLDEVRDAFEENQPLDPKRQERVDRGIREAEVCLLDVQKLLDSYESMYTQRKRMYDRAKFAIEDIKDLRSRITSHTTYLGILSQTIIK
jgi:hypothetical protein